MTHTPVLLHQHDKWTLMVSNHTETVKRLVVFVHGFNGDGLKTWGQFTKPGAHREWWLESDMLFIDYNSKRDGPLGVALRIRNWIDHFYPKPYAPAMMIDDLPGRADITTPYEELVLVGHSLGGLIIRRAILDVAMNWDNEGRTQDEWHVLLSATTRLFSPASAGFQSGGFLALVEESVFGRWLEFYLRRSPAFKDMQPNSRVLQDTQKWTEEIALEPGFEALRPRIVWANPDNVVTTLGYRTDGKQDSWDKTTHSKVCKPIRDHFENPWTFIEKGQVPT
ncbi:hypothetical protein BH09ACT9_BH09ACT9_26440 [soil metagenome]